MPDREGSLIFFVVPAEANGTVSAGTTKEPPAIAGGSSQAGYGIRTRGLNFGKVACYRYTKPAYHFLTRRIIADTPEKVKHFARHFLFPRARFMI